MHRLFSAEAAPGAREVLIEGREAHHAAHVLRVRRGEELSILDGRGGEYSCSVQEVGRHSLRVNVNRWNVTERPPYQVTLFQALPKGKAFENILQKATELGVYRIVPLITERVVARAEKHEKWQCVMIDAMKQCGNPWMPLLDPPHGFSDAVARINEFEQSLMGSLDVAQRNVAPWLKGVSNVALWIGPEGDFTRTETETLVKAGVKPMSLGRLVLRSDTAAISALTIVNYELDVRN